MLLYKSVKFISKAVTGTSIAKFSATIGEISPKNPVSVSVSLVNVKIFAALPSIKKHWLNSKTLTLLLSVRQNKIPSTTAFISEKFVFVPAITPLILTAS